MTDHLDHLLRPPQVEPLAAPDGHFDRIVARARTRRQRRVAATGLLAVVLLAGASTAAYALRPGHTDLPISPTGPVSSTVSPSPGSSAPGAKTPGKSANSRAALGTGPVPVHFKPWSVTYVSANVAFVLGDAPCQRPPCTSLVVTGDGGQTWRGLPAPRAALLPDRFEAEFAPGFVQDVRFGSQRDGWIFGGDLYSTHDGGRHWRKITLRTSTNSGLAVQDLATDGQRAYLLAAGCNTLGRACVNYQLYEATVDSDVWRPVAGVGAADGGRLSVSGVHGIVALYDYYPGSQVQVSDVWVRRGGSWARASAPPCATALAAVSASASSARLVAFCGEGAAGSVYLAPWVSDDNGNRWQRLAGVARVTDGQLAAAVASDSVFVLGSASPDLGGTVQRTTDGGRTFTEAALPRLSQGWWYVGARSATSLVALPAKPDGSLWTSSDAGGTWREYRFR